jgi:hypothetical protein
MQPANAHKQRSPRYQPPLNTVVVHGHEQCVSLISSSAAQVIPVRRIIIWLLGTSEVVETNISRNRQAL